MNPLKSLCLLLTLAASAAYSHHSTVIFDQGRTVSLTGEVVEWFSGRPHAILTIRAVDDETGEEDTYTLEWGGVSKMVREENWDDSTFAVGDPVRITGFPSRIRHTDVLVESVEASFGEFEIDEPYSSAVSAESNFAPPPRGLDMPTNEIKGVTTGADWSDVSNVIGRVRAAVEGEPEKDYEIHFGNGEFAYESFYIQEADFAPGTPVLAEGFLAEEETRLILFPRYMGLGDEPPTRLGQIANQLAAQHAGIEFGGGGGPGGALGMGAMGAMGGGRPPGGNEPE